MRKLYSLFVIVLCFSASLFPYNQDTIIINDVNNILSASDKNEITVLINTLRNDLGSELAVLIVNNTNEKNIEEYSLDYCNKNKIGSKNNLDGLLIVVSLESRKVRIEVGYGLEKIITDDISGKIIRDTIAPYFKKAQYGIGIIEAIKIIDDRIRTNSELIGDLKGIKVN
jgi:uncharacterized protein